MTDEARLFFGAEVAAPWPTQLPDGRMLAPEGRHVTLAFLGNTSLPRLLNLLPGAPPPACRVGPVGRFNKLIFLPEAKPRVVAYHIQWLAGGEELTSYQELLVSWLRSHGYLLEERSFLPHVSIARRPFVLKEWKDVFRPLPMAIRAIHLYQSMGNLVYETRYSWALRPPLSEDYTGVQLQASSWPDLETHARVALAFRQPLLLSNLVHAPTCRSLQELQAELADTVSPSIRFSEISSDSQGILRCHMDL